MIQLCQGKYSVGSKVFQGRGRGAGVELGEGRQPEVRSAPSSLFCCILTPPSPQVADTYKDFLGSACTK